MQDSVARLAGGAKERCESKITRDTRLRKPTNNATATEFARVCVGGRFLLICLFVRLLVLYVLSVGAFACLFFLLVCFCNKNQQQLFIVDDRPEEHGTVRRRAVETRSTVTFAVREAEGPTSVANWTVSGSRRILSLTLEYLLIAAVLSACRGFAASEMRTKEVPC